MPRPYCRIATTAQQQGLRRHILSTDHTTIPALAAHSADLMRS